MKSGPMHQISSEHSSGSCCLHVCVLSSVGGLDGCTSVKCVSMNSCKSIRGRGVRIRNGHRNVSL